MLLSFPASIYPFKITKRNTRKRCEICSKLTIKIPERRECRCSGIFRVNFEHISNLFLVFLLLTLNKLMFAGLHQYFHTFFSLCYRILESIKIKEMVQNQHSVKEDAIIVFFLWMIIIYLVFRDSILFLWYVLWSLFIMTESFIANVSSEFC